MAKTKAVTKVRKAAAKKPTTPVQEALQATGPMPAFGIWKDRSVDGVDYQRKLRAEWDR